MGDTNIYIYIYIHIYIYIYIYIYTHIGSTLRLVLGYATIPLWSLLEGGEFAQERLNDPVPGACGFLLLLLLRRRSFVLGLLKGEVRAGNPFQGSTWLHGSYPRALKHFVSRLVLIVTDFGCAAQLICLGWLMKAICCEP